MCGNHTVLKEGAEENNILSINETEIDFVLVGRNNRTNLKDVKAIMRELHINWL